jgi:hypothetical protein
LKTFVPIWIPSNRKTPENNKLVASKYAIYTRPHFLVFKKVFVNYTPLLVFKKVFVKYTPLLVFKKVFVKYTPLLVFKKVFVKYTPLLVFKNLFIISLLLFIINYYAIKL